MTSARNQPAADRRVVSAALWLAGAVLWVASYPLDQPAPGVLRLAGLLTFAAAALALLPGDCRALWRDTFAPLRAEGRAHVWALIAIVALGLAFRVALLGLDSRFDEALSFLDFGSKPLGESMADYSSANNHILYSALVHISTTLLGESLFAIRLPALIAGTLLVGAMYGAGRALYDGRTGLLSAALAAASGPFIEYSVNGRGYTMIWLATAVCVILAARIAERDDRAALVLLAVVTALALYTIPTAALALASVGAWLAILLIASRSYRRLAELVFACAAGGVLALGLFQDTLSDPGWKYRPDSGWGYAPTHRDHLELTEQVWKGMSDRLGLAGLVILVALCVAGLVWHRRLGRRALPLAVVGVALAAIFASADKAPPQARFWEYLAVFVYPLAAAGAIGLLSTLRGPAIRLEPVAVAVAALLGAIVVIGRPPYSIDDAPVLGAERLIGWAQAQPGGESLLVSPESYPAFALTIRLERAANVQLAVGYAEFRARGPVVPKLVVSTTRRETATRVMRDAGTPLPHPPARLLERFDEVEVYAIDLRG